MSTLGCMHWSKFLGTNWSGSPSQPHLSHLPSGLHCSGQTFEECLLQVAVISRRFVNFGTNGGSTIM